MKFDRIQSWTQNHRLGLIRFVPLMWGFTTVTILVAVYQQQQALDLARLQSASKASALAQIAPAATDLLAVADLHQSHSPQAKSRSIQLRSRLDRLDQALHELDSDAHSTKNLQVIHKQMVTIVKRMAADSTHALDFEVETAAVCNLIDFAVTETKEAFEETSANESTQAHRLGLAILGAIVCSLIGSGMGTWTLWNSDRCLGRLGTLVIERLTRPARVRQLITDESRPVESPTTEPVTQVSLNLATEEKDIVEAFLDKLSEQVLRLRTAVVANDLSAIVEIASWLSGAAGTFGFDQFTIPSQALENAAAKSNASQIQEHSQQIEELADQVLSAVTMG